MNVKLKARTADHVKTYWERTKDPEIRALIPIAELNFEESLPVSYTHLDVYKRQKQPRPTAKVPKYN